ncbi:hypothetical protein EN742_02985 [Mesorhizobium sp. M4A.F.Ca.ET.020.02.1.1]|uniref:hypothetical protein n=1 Tax=Mesorhizobium sp. M4A.F.Ca.ET.020.02.1.1 TaxID=2496652 RepID=UPI000FD322ED|nr:hypothetical protein [Mesorhizobium sp. M4A.F.Ca.ET.020.02.1.1]RVD44210.1 hypothetical protein EN742_02985 [Mesorhizobium sp. M4A.F.Ca.ET.020.02.1.1]
MSSVVAFDTISQRLTASWTTTDLVFENDPYDLPGTPAAFVYVEMWGIPGGFDQESIGGGADRDDNLWRECGTLDIHVMVPNGTGSRDARVKADALIDLFRGFEIGDVTFLEASVGEGKPGRQFANYWAMTASISWRRDQ